MGQFSWLDCKTNRQILDDVIKDVYVLVPREFGGGHIVEHRYDGYGRFGGRDIYDLVADWNRSWLSKNPDHVFPSVLHRMEFIREYQKAHPEYKEDFFPHAAERDWYSVYADMSLSRQDVEKILHRDWREIGIDIACYDKDNATLLYPIKITCDKTAVYEACAFSWTDPNQGWSCSEDEDEY